MQKIIQFFREAMAELSRVTWPTKQKTAHYTILVVVISIAVAIFLGVLDYFFGLGIGEFLSGNSGEAAAGTPTTTTPEITVESGDVEVQAEVSDEAIETPTEIVDEITVLEEEN